jgi:hypothetical protein
MMETIPTLEDYRMMLGAALMLTVAYSVFNGCIVGSCIDRYSKSRWERLLFAIDALIPMAIVYMLMLPLMSTTP